MQQDQFKGMLDRALAGVAMWLLMFGVNKGFLTQNDATQLLPALVLLPSIAWGWWVNRDKALLESASNVPAGDGKMTQIVTSPELAASIPAQNVVSSSESKVVTK